MSDGQGRGAKRRRSTHSSASSAPDDAPFKRRPSFSTAYSDAVLPHVRNSLQQMPRVQSFPSNGFHDMRHLSVMPNRSRSYSNHLDRRASSPTLAAAASMHAMASSHRHMHAHTEERPRSADPRHPFTLPPISSFDRTAYERRWNSATSRQVVPLLERNGNGNGNSNGNDAMMEEPAALLPAIDPARAASRPQTVRLPSIQQMDQALARQRELDLARSRPDHNGNFRQW